MSRNTSLFVPPLNSFFPAMLEWLILWVVSLIFPEKTIREQRLPNLEDGWPPDCSGIVCVGWLFRYFLSQHLSRHTVGEKPLGSLLAFPVKPCPSRFLQGQLGRASESPAPDPSIPPWTRAWGRWSQPRMPGEPQGTQETLCFLFEPMGKGTLWLSAYWLLLGKIVAWVALMEVHKRTWTIGAWTAQGLSVGSWAKLIKEQWESGSENMFVAAACILMGSLGAWAPSRFWVHLFSDSPEDVGMAGCPRPPEPLSSHGLHGGHRAQSVGGKFFCHREARCWARWLVSARRSPSSHLPVWSVSLKQCCYLGLAHWNSNRWSWQPNLEDSRSCALQCLGLEATIHLLLRSLLSILLCISSCFLTRDSILSQ